MISIKGILREHENNIFNSTRVFDKKVKQLESSLVKRKTMKDISSTRARYKKAIIKVSKYHKK